MRNHSTKVFNNEQMKKLCGEKVLSEFRDAVLTGKELSAETKKSIADGMLKWSRGQAQAGRWLHGDSDIHTVQRRRFGLHARRL